MSRWKRIQNWGLGVLSPDRTVVESRIDKSVSWSDEFAAREIPSDKDQDGAVALDYAWRKYDQTEEYITAANAKDDALMRNAVVFAAAEIGIVKALNLDPNLWFLASFSSVVACIIVLLHSRRTRMGQTLTPIREILEPLWCQKERRWWLAAAIHPVVDSTIPFAEWKMRMNNYATNCLIAALLLLIPTAMTLESAPEPMPAAIESAVARPAVEAQDSGAASSDVKAEPAE